jgi:hypothetical protein
MTFTDDEARALSFLGPTIPAWCFFVSGEG